MGIVIRVCVDGKIKFYYDEYKSDCFDEVSLREVQEDIEGFLLNALAELEDDEIVDRVAL